MDATTPKLRIVPLPDGTSVEISDTPLDWWRVPNASGYVSPYVLVPDPANPRRRMNPSRLAELKGSIAARGVRSPLVVTPLECVPWFAYKPTYRGKFFLIVGGHRRTTCAEDVGIEAVPIKIAIYPSEKEHRMDASILNKGNEDLTDLDKGFEALDLQRVGWKVEDLCTFFSCKAPSLYMKMNLTKLDPALQLLLDPDLPREKMLTTGVGGALGGIKEPTMEELDTAYNEFYESVKGSHDVVKSELLEELSGDERRFALQKLLYAVTLLRGLGAVRSEEFIKERRSALSASGATGRKTERYQPARRKQLLRGLVSEIHGSVAMDWKPSDIEKIFELAPREEVEDFIDELTNAAEFLGGLVKILGKIRDGKKPTRAGVLELMKHTAQ